MDIAIVPVVDIDNDVRIQEARERFAVYQDHQQPDAERHEALLFAVQRSLPEAHLPAATLLLAQNQPDRQLFLRGDDNTVCQFFRESVLLDRCEELCSFPTYHCDNQALIRNCDDPLTQCYFCLSIIAHFPYFVRDTDTATQFLRRIRRLLPVPVEFPELDSVYENSLPVEVVYYKAEKHFTSFVNHRIQVLRDRVIPNYGQQEITDSAVWLVLLCERCHLTTNDVPATLKKMRADINNRILTRRPPNSTNLQDILLQSALHTSFKNVVHFMSDILPDHSTVKYILGKCILDGVNRPSMCRAAAELGCPFALITTNDGVVVTPQIRHTYNLFNVAEIFFKRKMFMEAFLFAKEGCAYLNYLNPNTKTSCIDLSMKVYLCVGRFDLARNLVELSNSETAQQVQFLIDSNEYFQTIDVFLWFNIYRPDIATEANRYLTEKAGTAPWSFSFSPPSPSAKEQRTYGEVELLDQSPC
ncbi:hypothetical protein GEMRC1_000807 [Eukaryota sp. GEM-RC1]